MESITDRHLLWFIAVVVAIMLIGFLFVNKSGGTMSFGTPKLNLPKKAAKQTPKDTPAPDTTPGTTN